MKKHLFFLIVSLLIPQLLLCSKSKTAAVAEKPVAAPSTDSSAPQVEEIEESISIQGNQIPTDSCLIKMDSVYMKSERIAGPLRTVTYQFEVIDNNLYAKIVNRIYCSKDNGSTWKKIDSGMPPNTSSGKNMVAGKYCFQLQGVWDSSCGDEYYRNIVMRSADGGKQWTRVTAGLPSNSCLSVNALIEFAGNIYANVIYDPGDAEPSYCGLYRSTNFGNSWKYVPFEPPDRSIIVRFIVAGNRLFAKVMRGGNYVTLDGIHWHADTSGLPFSFSGDIVSLNGCYYVIGDDTNRTPRLFFSKDSGAHWKASETEPPFGYNQPMLYTAGNALFAHDQLEGAFISTDGGNSWKSISHGLPVSRYSIRSIAVSGTNLFVGTDHFMGNPCIKFLRSIDNGKNWSQVSLYERFNGGVYFIMSFDNYCFASTGEGMLFRSIDNGNSWKQVLKVHSPLLFCEKAGSQLFFAGFKGIYRSLDSGINWMLVNKETMNEGISAFVCAGDTLYVSRYRGYHRLGGVCCSIDGGASWDTMNTGLPNSYYQDENYYQCSFGLILVGPRLYAQSECGIFRFSDSSREWSAVDSGPIKNGINAVAEVGSYLFMGNNSGLFRSSDGGLTWNRVVSDWSSPYAFIKSLSTYSNALYVNTVGRIWKLEVQDISKSGK